MYITVLGQQLPIEETELDIDLIVPNPSQPRKLFSENSLDALEDSITKNGGIAEPILVEYVNDSCFMLVDGERRWRIYKKLGLPRIKAKIITQRLTEQQRYAIWVIIHIEQKDWTSVEKEQMVVDAVHVLGIQTTSEIFRRSEKDIEKTFKVLELAKKIERRRPLDYAKEIIYLPTEIRTEFDEVLFYKINKAKVKTSKDLRLLKHIYWNKKAKETFMQPDTDIQDAAFYVHLSNFKEKLIFGKPKGDITKLKELEKLINTILMVE